MVEDGDSEEPIVLSQSSVASGSVAVRLSQPKPSVDEMSLGEGGLRDDLEASEANERVFGPGEYLSLRFVVVLLNDIDA